MAIPAALLVWAGCSEDDRTPTSPSTPEVFWLIRPPNLVMGSTAFFPLQVTPINVSLPQVDSVRATISDSTGQPVASFRLYDDGSAFDLTDNLGFASLRSGDNVPHDGIYNRSINSLFTTIPGVFHVQVSCWSAGNSLTTGEAHAFSVAPDAPPQIALWAAPDSLPSGFFYRVISVNATDPDSASGDHASAVRMRLHQQNGSLPDTTYNLINSVPLSDLYQLALYPSFAAARPTGSYDLIFKGYDTFNLASDSIIHTLYMENLPPHLAEPGLPDTVVHPDSVISFLISIKCWDDQSVSDLDLVNYRAQKPDGSFSNNGNPFPLFDNGLPYDSLWSQGHAGDQVAGDSVYSLMAFMDSQAQIGLYKFYFKAQDKTGNYTEMIDSLRVVP